MTTPKFSTPNRQNVIAGPLAGLLTGLVVLLAVLAVLLALGLRPPDASFALQSASTTSGRSDKSVDASDAIAPLPQAITATVEAPCNWAALVFEGAPFNQSVIAGKKFTQTWRLKNIGTCAWNRDYEIIFVSGSDFNTPLAQKLATTVGVGETIEISLELTAPDKLGDYIATYQLRSDDGVIFGLDKDFNQPLWAAISVTGE